MKLSKTILTAVLGALLLAGVAQNAGAAFITGDIGFNGQGTGSTGVGTSTLTFSNMKTDPTLADGSYSPLASPTAAQTVTTFNPITWGPGSTLISPVPGGIEWQFVFNGLTYEFDLLSLQNAFMSSNQVSLAGTGILKISGLQDTSASFSVQGTGTGSMFFRIVQASNSAAVPEGGSAIALLGFSLVAVEILRRKFLAA